MRVVVFGTPDFAVPTLERVAAAGHTVAAVVTAPDRPAGRGHQPRPPAMKLAAQRLGIPVLQPPKLKDPAFLAQLSALRPTAQVVVAFRMLPKVVWALPPLGTLNLHAALLPDYRGAAPIQWVLINGEALTGATTFWLDDAIDTGPMLLQRSFPLPETWTGGDLHDHLMNLGAELVLDTLDALGQDLLRPQRQDPAGFVHPAPKLTPETGFLDWAQPRQALYNRIRALAPYPTAWSRLDGQQLKIFAAHVGDAFPTDQTQPTPGTLRLGKRTLEVATGDGWLYLDELQLQGRKRLPVADFRNGYTPTAQAMELP